MTIWTRLLQTGRRLFETDAPSGESESRALSRELACGPDPDDRDFTAAVVGLGAKLAKADGFVSDDEVAVFSRVFRADPKDWPAVKRVFNLARQTVRGYEGYARKIARRYADRPCLLEGILDGLFHIAGADGIITPEELEYLQTVSRTFGFTEDTFERIKAIHLGPEPDDPYVVLGVDRRASFDDIRAAYRRLMAEHHPDRVLGQGAPKEFERAATQRAAALTSAFARIRAARGLLIRASGTA